MKKKEKKKLRRTLELWRYIVKSVPKPNCDVMQNFEDVKQNARTC